jgi:hypothetical protein
MMWSMDLMRYIYRANMRFLGDKNVLNIYNSIRRQEYEGRRWALCKKNDEREEGVEMQNTQSDSDSSFVVVDTEDPTRRLILDLNLPSPLDNYDQKLLHISL